MTDTGPHEEAIPPGDAFALLGNETRMDILQALWEEREPLRPATENALPFTELRERVGMTDPGQFNYHLNQLVGQFVRRTDRGYHLHTNVLGVLRAVATRNLTGEGERFVTPASDPCPLCGSAVEVTYDEPTLTVRCTACPGEYRSRVAPEGTLMTSRMVPATGVEDRDGQELWEALCDHLATTAFGFLRGVCPVCAGRPTADLDACPDHAGEGLCAECGSTQAVLATMYCDHCTAAWRFPAWVAAMTHPEVIHFFHDRGVDADAGLTLDAYNRLLTSRQVVRSTDPVELEVVLEVGGDELAMTIDESLELGEVRA